MLLNRREFTGLGVALSSFMAPLGASAIDATSGATSSSAERTVRFRDGTVVPVLGQGLPVSQREDIRRMLRKKHCALAFHLA